MKYLNIEDYRVVKQELGYIKSTDVDKLMNYAVKSNQKKTVNRFMRDNFEYNFLTPTIIKTEIVPKMINGEEIMCLKEYNERMEKLEILNEMIEGLNL